LRSIANEESKSILLVDEVDVFFSKNFGDAYRQVVRIQNANIAEIQKHIWIKVRDGETDQKKLMDSINTEFFEKIKTDKVLSILQKLSLLQSHIESIVDTAIRIYDDMNKENKYQEKYKIINKKIHLKLDSGKYDEGYFCGHENSFCYLKIIYEKDKTFTEISSDNNDGNFGYLMLSSGIISYSEIPKSYSGIFGVTGTLKDLSNSERELLKYYQINKLSYYPSFFGNTRLSFDVNTDFHIKADKNNWFNSIVSSAKGKTSKDRSALIVFDTETLLDDFCKSRSGDLGDAPYCVTLNKIFDGKKEKPYSDSDVNTLITDQYAGHHGKITLLTKDYGRGVDFQPETSVNQKGGIHVIQTFFSIDIKEEIQIRGRTARKDQSGSYELILCLDHLKESISQSITDNTTYSELDRQRREKINSLCVDKLEQIKKHNEAHERTLKFFERALTTRNNSNRNEFIKEIHQNN
jgi:hypothetical protein